MNKQEKIIGIICYANYCRSPVAEALLNERKFQNIQFISQGIDPKISSDMDPRSRKYLKDRINYSNIHTPRKITRESVNKLSLILCLDHFVLMHLNQKFPSAKEKIKIFSFKKPKTIIEDPYRFNEENYIKNMKKIDEVCLDFVEDDFHY